AAVVDHLKGICLSRSHYDVGDRLLSLLQTMSGRQLHTGFPGTNTLHSEQCRAEIQRFESVHPCIYQIYDMLECLPLPPEYAHMRDEIRDQVVCIE
ncbi:hypothetical protein TELCIR_16687, partial [Teladorsagia circumcincta]